MKLFLALLALSAFLFNQGCGMFQNKREQEIKERLRKIQEEIDIKTDSIRKERYKLVNDSAYDKFSKEMDSLKRSSDSLEKVIKKNIEELKKKNKQ